MDGISERGMWFNFSRVGEAKERGTHFVWPPNFGGYVWDREVDDEIGLCSLNYSRIGKVFGNEQLE
jgi:hypothetical protein